MGTRSFFWVFAVDVGAQSLQPSSVAFPDDEQGARWEVKQPELEPVSVQDADVAGG